MASCLLLRILDSLFFKSNELEAGIEYDFWVECTDNIDVDKVQIEINSENFNDTFGLAQQDDKWVTSLELEFIGETEFTIICNDVHENNVTKDFVRNVIPVRDCIVKDLELYSIKKEDLVSRPVFECSQEVPVEISLNNFEFDSDSGENETEISVYLDDGNQKHNLRENDSIELDDADYLKIAIRSNASGFYTGELHFNFPKWVKEDVSIDLVGKIGDITITESFSKYVGDGYLNCEANVTEEQDSKYQCTVE